MTKADDDRARIAELRRQARIAQGREPGEPDNIVSVPIKRWTSGAGEIEYAEVGPGAQFHTLEEAARRLKISVRELEARAELAEVGRWGGFLSLAEVGRLASQARA